MKRTTARGLTVLGTAVLVAIALAACGGGGSSSTSTTSSKASATNAADTQGPTSATGATGSALARRTALAACLKKYGVTLPSFGGRFGADRRERTPLPVRRDGRERTPLPVRRDRSQRASRRLPRRRRRLRQQPEARAGTAEMRRLWRLWRLRRHRANRRLQHPDPHGTDELRRVHEEERRNAAHPQPERDRQRVRQRQPDDRHLQDGLRAMQRDPHLPEPPAQTRRRNRLDDELTARRPSDPEPHRTR